MSKISTTATSLQREESDLDILLRERLIKFLVTREKKNISWSKEDTGRRIFKTYNIESPDHEVQFRYKIDVRDYRLVFRLCNVSFSEEKRRQGILTGMMQIVTDFAPRIGYDILQVECPHTVSIISWLKKNGYKNLGTDVWEKAIK